MSTKRSRGKGPSEDQEFPVNPLIDTDALISRLRAVAEEMNKQPPPEPPGKFLVHGFLVPQGFTLLAHRALGEWLCSRLTKETRRTPQIFVNMHMGSETRGSANHTSTDVNDWGWICVDMHRVRRPIAVRPQRLFGHATRVAVVSLADATQDLIDAMTALREFGRKHRRLAVVRLADAATKLLRVGPGKDWVPTLAEPAELVAAADDPDEAHLHPNARKLLRSPLFWEVMTDWAPHGSDTGHDAMARVVAWQLGGRHGGVRGLVQSTAEALVVDADELSRPAVDVGLAFGLIKVTGECPAGLARRALQGLEVMAEVYGSEARRDLATMRRALERWL